MTRSFWYELNLFVLLAAGFTVLLHVLNRWRVARIAARASYKKDRDEAEDEKHVQKQKSFSHLCNFGLSYSADILRRFPGSSLIGVASAACYHGPMFEFFIGLFDMYDTIALCGLAAAAAVVIHRKRINRTLVGVPATFGHTSPHDPADDYDDQHQERDYTIDGNGDGHQFVRDLDGNVDGGGGAVGVKERGVRWWSALSPACIAGTEDKVVMRRMRRAGTRVRAAIKCLAASRIILGAATLFSFHGDSDYFQILINGETRLLEVTVTRHGFGPALIDLVMVVATGISVLCYAGRGKGEGEGVYATVRQAAVLGAGGEGGGMSDGGDGDGGYGGGDGDGGGGEDGGGESGGGRGGSGTLYCPDFPLFNRVAGLLCVHRVAAVSTKRRAARIAILGRRIRLLFRVLQPLHLVLCWVWIFVLRSAVAMSEQSPGMGPFHIAGPIRPGAHSIIMEGRDPQAHDSQAWFMGTHFLAMIVDLCIAGGLELTFADVLVQVLSSTARFGIISYALPFFGTAHYAAVLFIYATALGVYLTRARRRLRRGDADREVRRLADELSVWARS